MVVGMGISVEAVTLSMILFMNDLAISTRGGSKGLVCGSRRENKIVMRRAICGGRNTTLTGCVGCGCGCGSRGHVARDRTLG